MTAVTLFGMVALMIASVTMHNGIASMTAQHADDPKTEPAEFKKAA